MIDYIQFPSISYMKETDFAIVKKIMNGALYTLSFFGGERGAMLQLISLVGA